MSIEVTIRNRWNMEVVHQSGERSCNLCYRDSYLTGDHIEIQVSHTNQFYMIGIDDAMEQSLVYMTEKMFLYEIPFGEKHESYPVHAFQGNLHVIRVRKAEKWEWTAYRNQAYNCLDQHVNYGVFPHAKANVETRGESVFAARNAIDGYTLGSSHGIWPYESWGINRQDDAFLMLEFGRDIWTDRIDLFLRADFPHDNWWNQVTFSFSDGTQMNMELEKTNDRQSLLYKPKKISWVKMHDMQKAEEESPFPALSQIEVYGKDDGDEREDH